MAKKQLVEPVPAGLGSSGAGLWTSVTNQFELEAHEQKLLREACRTTDSIDALQAAVDRDGVLSTSPQGLRAHPGLVELRQQRMALTKLLAALAIPSEPVAGGQKTSRYGIRGAVS